MMDDGPSCHSIEALAPPFVCGRGRGCVVVVVVDLLQSLNLATHSYLLSFSSNLHVVPSAMGGIITPHPILPMCGVCMV